MCHYAYQQFVLPWNKTALNMVQSEKNKKKSFTKCNNISHPYSLLICKHVSFSLQLDLKYDWSTFFNTILRELLQISTSVS